MGGSSAFGRGLPLVFCVLVGGSLAATCVYECEQTGGCVAKYSGPPRSGNTIGSCFSEFFGGACSGTPPECLDCNKAIQCERNSSISTGGALLTKHAGGYGYEYVDYNQPPSVNYKCPLDPGTPNDDCTAETPCFIGEGPCSGKNTCEDGLRCGTKNCGNFPGNNNADANCCYDPYQPGGGDQFVFDVNTVLGQQMFKTLDWLDEAEDETRVTCCGGDGQNEAKTCGGPTGKSCKDICGKGTRYHFAFENFDDTECSADLFFRNTDIWTMGDVCPAPKIWVPYTPPDYTTYEHQSLASYSRRKRNPDDTDKSKDVSHVSFDATYCKEKSLYSSENLLANKKHLNCCKVGKETFRINARAQGGGGRAGGKVYQSARKTCCKESSKTSLGTDALQVLCRASN